MISEIDETIRQVLVKEGGFDPNEVDISFDIPTREWSGSISKPTLNCYLFDIRENVERRQQGVQTEKQGTNGAARRRSKLFFDLTYLVTAWTRAVEDEHRLLWHALATLVRFNSLPAEHLQGALLEYEGYIYTQTAQPNGVLKSPGDFWGALENQLKPSVAYVVTTALERDAFPAGPPVLTTTLRFRQPEQAAPEEFIWFGGVVRDVQEAPVHGASVAIEGRLERASTDAEGRFRLRVPRPGQYTLVIQMGSVTQRREIDVPAVSYALTLQPEIQPASDDTKQRGPQKGGRSN